MVRQLYFSVAFLLIGAIACGETYSVGASVVDGGKPSGDGGMQSGDGTIVLPDGAVVPADGAPATSRWPLPHIAFGMAGSCFTGTSNTTACRGTYYYNYCEPASGDPNDPPPTCYDSQQTLEQAGLSGPVRKALIGGGHTCQMVGDSSVGLQCFGNNLSKAINLTAVTEQAPMLGRTVIAGFEDGVDDMMLGNGYTCALKQAKVTCWGEGVPGGPGPQVIALPETAVELAGGAYFQCARTAAGDVYCWGFDAVPTVNANGAHYSATPVKIQVGGKVAALAASPESSHVCARMDSGVISCWGKNDYGQSGAPIQTRIEPTFVSALQSGNLDVVVGLRHTCVLRADGSVSCWGSHFDGALGDNGVTKAATPTPVQVKDLTSGVTRLFAGGSSTCALKGTGVQMVPMCWGSNSEGLLRVSQAGGWVTSPLISSFP